MRAQVKGDLLWLKFICRAFKSLCLYNWQKPIQRIVTHLKFRRKNPSWTKDDFQLWKILNIDQPLRQERWLRWYTAAHQFLQSVASMHQSWSGCLSARSPWRWPGVVGLQAPRLVAGGRSRGSLHPTVGSRGRTGWLWSSAESLHTGHILGIEKGDILIFRAEIGVCSVFIYFRFFSFWWWTKETLKSNLNCNQQAWRYQHAGREDREEIFYFRQGRKRMNKENQAAIK